MIICVSQYKHLKHHQKQLTCRLLSGEYLELVVILYVDGAGVHQHGLAVHLHRHRPPGRQLNSLQMKLIVF